jgi:hypothetical protein
VAGSRCRLLSVGILSKGFELTWEQVELLLEAVEGHNHPSQANVIGHGSNDSSMKVNKISWKNVAKYIKNNGGSYLYGNATCKKKWNEIQGRVCEGRNRSLKNVDE